MPGRVTKKSTLSKSIVSSFQVTKSELQNIKEAEPQSQGEVQGHSAPSGEGQVTANTTQVGHHE